MKLLFKGGKLDSRHVYDLTASTWTANRYFTDRKHPTVAIQFPQRGTITPDSIAVSSFSSAILNNPSARRFNLIHVYVQIL